MATVHITVADVNDNVPYFHSYSTQFTVKENVQIGWYSSRFLDVPSCRLFVPML